MRTLVGPNHPPEGTRICESKADKLECLTQTADTLRHLLQDWPLKKWLVEYRRRACGMTRDREGT